MARISEDAAIEQPLRLLWLIDSLTLGGAESLVLPFAQSIDRREVELLVCCLKSIASNPIEDQLRQAQIPVVNLGARNLRDVGAFRRLLNLLRERQIQVVHAHLTYAVIWGVAACRLSNIPIVASLHVAPTAAGGLHRDSLREWLMIESLRWRDAITLAVSEAVKEAFVRKYSIPSRQIQVAHNGVKTITYERRNRERGLELRRKIGFPTDARVLITVSVLRTGKGIEILLRALASVRGSVKQVRLLIVGEGPMQEQWQRLARHLGVDNIVHWTGYRRDVPALLAGSDLFVLPSREDAFPTVLLEAMAAELPIVATQVGGVPEILHSPSVGTLVPPGDPAAMAAAIQRMLTDEAASKSMAAAARRRVSENFSMQRWLDELMKLYRRARGQRVGALRIAVVEFAGKGGLIHYAFQLCRAMSAAGAQVTLLTDQNYELDSLEHPFRLKKIFNLWDPKPATAETRSSLRRALRGIQYYRQWRSLLTHLREERYDVVQFGDIRFPTDFFALRIARRHVRLLTDVCHNVERFSRGGEFKASGLAARLYRRLYRLFDTIFVHYEVNRNEFQRCFPEIRGRLRVIEHGNQELFGELRAPLTTANRLRTQLGLFPSDEVVLFFGTLSAYKGIDLLVEAFASVALRYPRARLMIIGFPLPDFNIDSHLSMARGLGLGDRVQIVAEYIDSSAVAAWIELGSVVVFPYRQIYQSGALHLAQTFGAPIVATQVGANAEVIEHEVTGLLVSPEDPGALAEAISTLLEDRELAARLGQAARKAALERFAWSRVAAEILNAADEQYEKARR